MTSMIQNYVNNIKNNNITVPQNKTQDALRTHVRAYRPTGYIIDENPYSLKSAFHSDMRSLKYFADGIRGRGNDYSIGKINDVAIKLGGLGIAGIIATSKGSPFRKGMEFVGLASWLAAMSLWSKLAVNTPLKLLKGVDLNSEYMTSQGHRKMFYQDPQFICWDMISDAQIDEMAQKMGIPQNIKNRRKAVENKARQIAIQGNTLGLLTAGFATPLAGSLLADKLGKNVLSPLVTKWQEMNAETLKDKLNAGVNNLLYNKDTEKLINTLSDKITPQTKEALYKLFDGINSDLTMQKTIHSTIDTILDSKNSSVTINDATNAKIAELLPKKANVKVNISELLKKLSDEFRGTMSEKELNSYLEKLNKELVKNHIVSLNTSKETILPQVKKLISSSKISTISAKDAKEQLINLSRLVITYNQKLHGDFEKKYFGYIWNSDTSVNAKLWTKMTNDILPALGADKNMIAKIANAQSEEATHKILGEFLDSIVKSPEKYDKAIQKLGDTALKVAGKNEKYLKFSLEYLDNMQKLLTAYDQNSSMAEISKQIANNISVLRKAILGKYLSTNNNAFAPIRILNILKEAKDMKEYKDIQRMLFENQSVDAFVNRLDNFKHIIRDEKDYERFTNMIFSKLSNGTRKNLSSALSAKIDDTSYLMKYLLMYQSDGVNVKYTLNDSNGAINALKKFGFYKYADELFDVGFYEPNKVFERIMDEVRKNPKKIDELRTFLHLSASDIEQIKADNFDSVYKNLMGSSEIGSGFLENGRHRFKTLLNFFGQNDFSGISDFKITGAKAGKISAMQGPTFKNFIKDSAKELFAYNGWFKKVGLAFIGLCAITAFGVSQIGKKNEFNPDIYEERRSA